MNTLKLIFSGMTAIIITAFVVTTNMDQPFVEKRTDCIINAYFWDVKNSILTISSTGSIELTGSTSIETINRAKLCDLYNSAHLGIIKTLSESFSWEMSFISGYIILALIILVITLFGDIVSFETNIASWNKKRQKKTKPKKKTWTP